MAVDDGQRKQVYLRSADGYWYNYRDARFCGGTMTRRLNEAWDRYEQLHRRVDFGLIEDEAW